MEINGPFVLDVPYFTRFYLLSMFLDVPYFTRIYLLSMKRLWFSIGLLVDRRLRFPCWFLTCHRQTAQQTIGSWMHIQWWRAITGPAQHSKGRSRSTNHLEVSGTIHWILIYNILPGIFPGILFGIYCDIPSRILSSIFSGILCGICFGILSDIGTAGPPLRAWSNSWWIASQSMQCQTCHGITKPNTKSTSPNYQASHVQV